jgi:segregation and condensation protein A
VADPASGPPAGGGAASPAPAGPFVRSIGYDVKIPGFEGPLDLLVTLAHQGKVDLAAIELSGLTGEFLDRVRRSLDLNEATEVLWMLAALVEMKARLLLPKPPPPDAAPAVEDAGDLPERLEERLAEYRAFKEAADALRALEELQRNIFTRGPEDAPPDLLLEGVTVDDLFRAFNAVLARARRQQAAEVAEEPVRVADRMRAILQALARAPRGLDFADLFGERASAVFIVVTFLALLELIKDRRVRAHQESPFAPIRLMAVSA